jgi:hypothetical protein
VILSFSIIDHHETAQAIATRLGTSSHLTFDQNIEAHRLIRTTGLATRQIQVTITARMLPERGKRYGAGPRAERRESAYFTRELNRRFQSRQQRGNYHDRYLMMLMLNIIKISLRRIKRAG